MNCLKVVEGCLHGQLEEEAVDVLKDDMDDIAQGLVALGVYSELSIVAQNQPALGKLSVGPGTLNLTEIILAATCFSSTFRILITLCERDEWCSSVMRSTWCLPWVLRTAISPLPPVIPPTGAGQDRDVLSSDNVASHAPLASSQPTDGLERNVDAMCYALALLTNILQHHGPCAELVGSTGMAVVL